MQSDTTPQRRKIAAHDGPIGGKTQGDMVTGLERRCRVIRGGNSALVDHSSYGHYLAECFSLASFSSWLSHCL